MTAVEVRLRPLVGWPYATTEHRKSITFRSSWSATKRLLADEVEALGGELVVVEFDIIGGEAAFRVDGSLRANAKAGAFPGVRVSFRCRHGDLSYATDRYAAQYSGQVSWQANVRAVALSLEALRAVDRHGVTRAGEQYTGWRAIEAGGSTSSTFATADEAARWVAEQAAEGGRGKFHPRDIAAGGEYFTNAYRALARRLHPDVGGDPADWARLDEARRLIEAAAR
jgi:hypothetical protein